MTIKYNHWTFLEDLGEDPNKKYRYLWKVQCDCGYIGVRVKRDIIKGNSKQCKSCTLISLWATRVYKECKPVKPIEIGHKFGNWIIVSKSHFKEGHWECKCDWGKIKVHPERYIRSELSSKCQQCETKRRRKIIIQRKSISFAKKSPLDEEEVEAYNNKISPINNINRRYLK
jgi:hypothetical protein